MILGKNLPDDFHNKCLTTVFSQYRIFRRKTKFYCILPVRPGGIFYIKLGIKKKNPLC